MLDIFFLAELAWCTVAMGVQPLRRAITLTGGVMASAFVADRSSGWLDGVLISPTSPVFVWLENHVAPHVESVLLQNLIPPEPTAFVTSAQHVQWVVYQILHSLFFMAMTGTVFILFAMVSILGDALQDRELTATRRTWTNTGSWALGIGCGAITAAGTAVLIGRLAWLRPLHDAIPLIDRSALIYWIAKLPIHVS